MNYNFLFRFAEYSINIKLDLEKTRVELENSKKSLYEVTNLTRTQASELITNRRLSDINESGKLSELNALEERLKRLELQYKNENILRQKYEEKANNYDRIVSELQRTQESVSPFALYFIQV